jgi:hypothetical protein
MVQSVPSLGIRKMRHNIGVFAITYPFLVPPHLLHHFFAQEQPFQPWRDRYVTKVFDHHFCGDRCPIFVYHLDISGPTTMLTFDVILVLLLKQHAIFFTCINLLVVHSDIDTIFLDWYKSFGLLCFAGLRSIINITISL